METPKKDLKECKHYWLRNINYNGLWACEDCNKTGTLEDFKNWKNKLSL